jgi:hypothetical protein
MNESTPITVTIFASGDSENTPAEAVHHALAYAHKAGFIEGWSDPIPAALRASAPQGDGRALAWRPVETIADLVNNLRTMDQALPIYGAFHRDGRAFARSVSVSLEKVIKGEILPTQDAPYSAVIWTSPVAALSAPPSVALEAVLEPFAKLAALFDNYEIDRRKPEADSVLVNVKLDDLRKARAALTRPQPGGAVAGTERGEAK